MKRSKISMLMLAVLLLGTSKSSIGSELELVWEFPASDNIAYIEAIEGLDNQPGEIVFATRNNGAGCGGGTPASAWKLILDPDTGAAISTSKKQNLSKIQNVRDTLFESSDGLLFTGGGWCQYKPPYVSADGGETWRAAERGTHPPNSTFAITEFDGDVYAGTGYSPYPPQVYRWVGSAATDWEHVFTVPQRGYVTSMAAYKNKLFVGTNLYAVGCSSSAPIYVSSNGSTFNATAGIPLCYEVYDILVVNEQLVAKVHGPGNFYWYHWNDTSEQWGNPSPMNLGTYSYLHSVSSGNLIYSYGRAPGDSSYGIYQSDDMGQSWEQIASTNAFTSVSMEVYNNTLYVGTSADSSGKAYLYRIKSDSDDDGIVDSQDNCPLVANADQNDLDSDNIGDTCDLDIDGDGVENVNDNCAWTANIGQEDTDGDNDGDACDDDDDNDGVLDTADNCSLISNPGQEDADEDGQGDVCDGDLDGDGVANETDNCPNVANGSQADYDKDGTGDVCDSDVDGDDVANDGDACAFTELDFIVDAAGCSIDQLCPCEGPRGIASLWKNHGKFVSCTAKSAESFVEDGLITEAEKDAIISDAAQSDCGDKK